MRLYLDVDGVLNPYVVPGEVPSSWPDFAEGYLGSRLVVHSPTMLTAVGRLGAEVVWCTTWGLQAERAFAGLLGPGSRRTLDLPGTPLAPGGVKGAAVLADLRADPAPFVWVDDDAITVDAAERLEKLELPMFLIEPQRNVGIEPSHVRSIGSFVDAQG